MVEKLVTTERHESMRGWFAYELHERMVENELIWVVMGGVGYGVFDRIRRDFPGRFVNTAAAEQAMIGVGVGLALEGQIPILYSITPFLLYRPFETVRNYLNRDGIGVKLVGSGRNRDYMHDGFSHWAEEDRELMKILSNIEAHWPETKEELPELLMKTLYNGKPVYINLRR